MTKAAVRFAVLFALCAICRAFIVPLTAGEAFQPFSGLIQAARGLAAAADKCTGISPKAHGSWFP